MEKPDNPLVHELIGDTLDYISQELATLRDHLTFRGDDEADNPEIANVFYGLSTNTILIQQAVEHVAGQLNRTLSFTDWLHSMPECPGRYESKTLLLQNPLIGQTQAVTNRNIQDVMTLLKTVASPSDRKNTGLSLGKKACRGYSMMVKCITGAMSFEEKCRKKDASVTEENADVSR